MIGIRKHGNSPYRVVVVHGGPGAPGSVRLLADEMGKNFGVLEPMQTVDSIDGQKKELAGLIEDHGMPPVVLIGHSWGAWLSIIMAAGYPDLVKALILINPGPFKEEYAGGIMKNRLKRLTKEDRNLFDALQKEWTYVRGKQKSGIFKEIGQLLLKADAFEPDTLQDPTLEYQPDIFQKIWTEASYWRRSGRLLETAGNIKCRVIAIHGENDPHPWQGVKVPLKNYVENFEFILLEKCGHEPWIERYAKNRFFKIIKEKIGDQISL